MSKVLIHIGYPKAGSTYLQRWFTAHPKLFHHPNAIAGFYNASDIARFAQANADSPDYFVISNEDLSVWKGDFGVLDFEGKGYDLHAYQDRLAQQLKDIFPAAKILIVTRGYASMFPSLYSQYVRSGGILTFDELHKAYGRHFALLYDYNWLIKLYQQQFGADKVIIVPFELLLENPAQFTSAIEDELGITGHYVFTTNRINASLTPKEITATRKLSKFIFKGLGILPAALQTRVYGYYIKYLAANRRSLLAQFLSKFYTADTIEVKEWMLRPFEGKTMIIRDLPLFNAYLKEYLLK